MCISCLPVNKAIVVINFVIPASDASGRYRGQLLFGNDFWVGSKQFCFEINNERREARKSVSKQPIFKFFVAQILFNVTMPTQQVSEFFHLNQPIMIR